MHLQFGPKMKDIYEVEELSFCTLNSTNSVLFSMKVIIKIDFLKAATTHQQSTHGKWQIYLPSNRIRLISKIV